MCRFFISVGSVELSSEVGWVINEWIWVLLRLMVVIVNEGIWVNIDGVIGQHNLVYLASMGIRIGDDVVVDRMSHIL